MFDAREDRSVNKAMLFMLIGVIVLLIAAVGVGGYYFKQYKSLKKDSSVDAKAESNRIIDRVKALYNTPNETPSIVQVQDQSKVKSQAFFKDARNGDYVLVYQKAKLAILYRESTNKIINTGPLSLSESANGTTGTN